MTDIRAVTRSIWMLLEPIHAVTYFSPEPLAALKTAGYRGFWMGYFAGRAAPLGAARPEVVHAVFYNFAFSRVSRALPSAWEFASPEAALSARSDGSALALRRQLSTLAEDASVARAAELSMRVAVSAPSQGRVLFAANSALPTPEDPPAGLWHAATLLREHRGDGHVAALLAAGIEGRESHVLHALANGTPRGVYTIARDFDDEEWNTRLESLRDKDLVDSDGLTDEGRRVKDDIEARTDALASSAYAALSAEELSELMALLRPLTRAVIESGDIPPDSPMGLNLRQVLDAG